MKYTDYTKIVLLYSITANLLWLDKLALFQGLKYPPTHRRETEAENPLAYCKKIK